MARWITAQVTNEAYDVSQLGECPSKCAAAERLKASLDKLWGDFDTGRLCGFLDTLGPATPAAVRDVHFDGHLLRRRARKAKRKAGGLDGWTGELVAALPLDFFDKLARLWTAIVKGGKLPLGWKQVGVAGIPEEGHQNCWRPGNHGYPFVEAAQEVCPGWSGAGTSSGGCCGLWWPGS